MKLVAFFVPLLTPLFSYAYLDPGSNSVVLQLLLGGISGALVLLHSFKDRIKSFFAKNKKNESVSENSTNTNGNSISNTQNKVENE